MLCSSKINNRPDRLLQSRLIKLAFALVLLTTAIILLFLYPQYHLHLVIITTLLTSYCLLSTIKTLDAGEAAICYGGFANEIIRNDFKARRIENPAGEPIIQNEPARDLLKDSNTLDFLERHLAEGPANKTAFQRLRTACQTLSTEKVTLSLALNPQVDRIFADVEWLEVSIRPMYLKRPEIFDGVFSVRRIRKETYLYYTLHNITAEKNMERIFKQECSSLHDFLDYLPVGLYVVDKDYQIEYINQEFAQFLGYKETDLKNRGLTDFLASNSALPSRSDQWQGSIFFSAADKVREAYVLQTGFRENEKIKMRGVVLTHLPSTGELSEKIEQASDQISWLFDNAPIGILFLDAQGRITDGNRAAFDFLGNQSDKIISHMLSGFVLPEDAAAVTKALENIAQGKSIQNLETRLTVNGKEIVASVFISAMRRFHSAAASPINGFVVYLIDATRQKSLEQQIAQAQKMQAIGQLAGGVAHDFNNLLTAIIGFTDLLLQRHGVGDPSFADLIQVKQNANRAAGLVRQLLAFSRKQPMQLKFIDVTDSLAELSHMLKRTILGEQIALKFHHGTNLGWIKIDPVQFSQVIINLIVNAKDAMNGSGTLTISTRTDVVTESFRFGDDIIRPGEFVVIDVSDTGCGIPPENLNRIFDPFFSTKENVVGSGTGLGLAMVYGIVCQSEGFIQVKSAVGQGTTFSICLPRFENDNEPAAEAEENRQAAVLHVEKVAPPVNINQKIIVGLNVSNTIDRTRTAPAKTARLLFVEDEDSVRAFAVRALQKKGYEVTECNSAENALEIFAQDSQFDLLITDMVLPGISGAELSKRLKEKAPKLKIILASGYSEEIVRSELKGFENCDFIVKPYSLGDLTAKIFDVLNRD